MMAQAGRTGRQAALAFAAMLAMLVPAAPAAADPGATMFKRLTDNMTRARKVQFCAYVAASGTALAGESPDPAKRAARAAAAARLAARFAPDLAKANAGLSPDDLAAIERENNEVMGLLSYAPSDELAALVEAEGEDADIVGLFADGWMRRCDGLANKLKLPPAPAMTMPAPAFRWRGISAAEAFANTGLAPFADRLCKGEALAAADFAGAPLEERGKDGVSLIDWAMACGDKAGFAALLAAGLDPATPSFFGNLILVRAAEKRDLFYLETLLAAGVKPDALGSAGTALKAAYDTMVPDGGKAWQMLRAGGASLNFPAYDWSMWSTWGLYADWEEMLAHWSEFGSDPVALARSISMDLDRSGGPRGNAAALQEIKARLIAEHGVCFPVGPTFGAPKDERGYILQPDCPTGRR